MYQGNLVNVSRVKKNTTQLVFPVDTERKLNVHKTFRRGPGRILDVLCTFNLRPVSTGLSEQCQGRFAFALSV